MNSHDAAEFWADHTRAGQLETGARIVDPNQSDVWDHLVQVEHVTDPDAAGMVTVTGRRGSGEACQLQLAADWPVQRWTSELAIFEAAVLGTEHTRLFGPASSTNPPAHQHTDDRPGRSGTP
ncbi:hypothetical protein [Amycolatopsis keratiniphila]|uniref:Uncharacterized protein n=1 Tax=Amycolatopsis keratiniphila subsp. keratiniphila TaxID=227715 RepID=A0A1W2M1Z2_9PSEU|nr:hypothetical protein [Amycolatopsis keratiniphila]ONF73928.1 hypothetical protein AVR91_0204145 [Amycolatopsis keratiniphila subsp. keratiniphila]